MDVTIQFRDETGVICLRGSFVFTGHREFRDAITKTISHPTIKEVEIDLSNVGYIDSSALGMLLMARDNATTAMKNVVLSGATGSVLQVLEIANFKKLFVMR